MVGEVLKLRNTDEVLGYLSSKKIVENKNWKGTTLRYGQEEILVNKIESCKREGREHRKRGSMEAGRGIVSGWIVFLKVETQKSRKKYLEAFGN